ncbi:methyltransferase [Pikeienuella piscinae]|uniref:Methyltransferase n=1 Tax=Pikeienuella piscinae TaxID=2748098 RepID=A0A7M3T590_9RHOB|nr:methyltransferase [Pikeienuella piscinae]QIE57171.1 methyltransferase [Pikeienuella piscinae]
MTEDALLGGLVRLLQPRAGYRAATDPVLLAAASAAKPGARVLDAGCGAGAAMLCLAARVPGLETHGLELQPPYAGLARRNADLNGVAAAIWDGDLFGPPAELRRIGFDIVMTNPPYFDAFGAPSPDPGRDAARRATGGRSAAEWTAAAVARLRSGGRFATIHLAAKLPEILAGLAGAGDIAVLPLQSRAGRDAKRVIVTARKGARGPFRIAPPLIIHDGETHRRDADDFSTAADAVLRRGAPLRF